MSKINNRRKRIEVLKKNLQTEFEFNLNDHLEVFELLEDCNNSLEASLIINLIGQISWKRQTVEKEIVDKVFHYISSDTCIKLGTSPISEGVSWVFSQWVDAGYDTVSDYFWKFRDCLLGVGDDNLYSIQPIAISAAGNYLKYYKTKEILNYLLIFCDELKYYKPDFIAINDNDQEELISNLHFQFRYDDSIQALRCALQLPRETPDEEVIAKARERLKTE